MRVQVAGRNSLGGRRRVLHNVGLEVAPLQRLSTPHGPCVNGKQSMRSALQDRLSRRGLLARCCSFPYRLVSPITGALIMRVDPRLVLTFKLFRRLEGRSAFHCFPSQTDRNLGIWPADTSWIGFRAWAPRGRTSSRWCRTSSSSTSTTSTSTGRTCREFATGSGSRLSPARLSRSL